MCCNHRPVFVLTVGGELDESLVGKAKAMTSLTHQLEVWASEESGRVSGGSVICTELPNSLILPNLLYMYLNPHDSSGGGRIQILYFQWK